MDEVDPGVGGASAEGVVHQADPLLTRPLGRT
jgi:hypothetical protein